MTRRIAEFDESDDALRFAKLKGADYTICAGIDRMWAVRPKSARELEGSVDDPDDTDD